MKKLPACLAACLLALPPAALAGPEPWSSIEPLGFSVGPPFHSPQGWLLVVRANLSGLGAIALDANARDSMPACKSTRAVVEGSNIYLTAISGPVGPRLASVCPAAKIGELEPGAYKVFYRGPNEKPVLLKEIRFER